MRTRALSILVMSIALIALGVLGGGGVASAQEPEPQLDVTASFDPPAATIGDRVTLEVRVRHDSDVVVTVERPDLPSAEVLGDAQPQTEGQDGAVVTSYEFRYQVFTLGELNPGELRVRWLREDGTTGVSLSAGPVLTVVSVRAPGDEALRPLKPQLTVGGAPPAWLAPVAVGAAVAVALGGVAGLVVWWRRRPRVVEVEAEADTAEARARERLDALRGRRLDDDEAFQAYYGTLAVTVRAYLGERFGFNAAALTTEELERRMTAHGVDRWQARLVGGLLDRCDRAVYARQYPDPASADHDLTVAYEIVELSRPRATDPAERPEAAAS